MPPVKDMVHVKDMIHGLPNERKEIPCDRYSKQPAPGNKNLLLRGEFSWS